MKKGYCSAYLNGKVFEVTIKPTHLNFQIPLHPYDYLLVDLYLNGKKYPGPASIRYTRKAKVYWITSEYKTKGILDKFLEENGVKRYKTQESKHIKNRIITRMEAVFTDDLKICNLKIISYQEYKNALKDIYSSVQKICD
ncbi:MAG: hypothetical protein ACOX5R_20510 [bacterium]